MGTVIGDYVFIAPMTITTNGNPIGYRRPQVTEKFGAERGDNVCRSRDAQGKAYFC